MSTDIQEQGASAAPEGHDPYAFFPGGRPVWPTSTWQERAADTSRERQIASNRATTARRDAKHMLECETSDVTRTGRARTIELMRRRG